MKRSAVYSSMVCTFCAGCVVVVVAEDAPAVVSFDGGSVVVKGRSRHRLADSRLAVWVRVRFAVKARG